MITSCLSRQRKRTHVSLVRNKLNTPGIIRYPFERIAAANPEAMLIRVNQENAEASYIDLTNILSIQEDLKVAIAKLKHP